MSTTSEALAATMARRERAQSLNAVRARLAEAESVVAQSVVLRTADLKSVVDQAEAFATGTASREAVAAARDEQREADIAALPFLMVEAGDPLTKSHVADAILDEAEERIRATPLTFTPLADIITNLRADLATATSLAKTLTEERDAARGSEKITVDIWEQMKPLIESQRATFMEALAERDQLRAELAAQAALATALQDEMNSTRTAHAATVVRVTTLENALKDAALRALAMGLIGLTNRIVVALEVKPEHIAHEFGRDCPRCIADTKAELAGFTTPEGA